MRTAKLLAALLAALALAAPVALAASSDSTGVASTAAPDEEPVASSGGSGGAGSEVEQDLQDARPAPGPGEQPGPPPAQAGPERPQDGGEGRQPDGSGSAGALEAPVESPAGDDPTEPPDLGTGSFPTPSIDMTPVPSISCAGAPPAPRDLLPIYREASERYGLGPEGPGILASINLIETRFGELNEVTSSAGAIGWMQFLPGTWDGYGVDANGDGEADPYDPRDAIFSAANYLSASGAPDDWYGAIFTYNRADWYVAEVLANAGCYGTLRDGALRLVPKLPRLSCEPAESRERRVPAAYMRAIERAAGRYELGRSGVWALAAIAGMESDFGRAMTPRELHTRGPFNIDPAIWREYVVDGDRDDEIDRRGPWDSAATLARMIWSYGDLREGVFNHNQASWYVEAVMTHAHRLEGDCEVTRVRWPIALPPNEVDLADGINWDNLDLTRDSQHHDILSGALDPAVMELLALITQRHQVMITSLRSDHSKHTKSGNVSNHYHGRAIDIAMVDGVSCADTSLEAPCSVLGRTLTLLPPRIRPTELIYCHDLDGPDGPAFAMPDHCGHVHVGFHAR